MRALDEIITMNDQAVRAAHARALEDKNAEKVRAIERANPDLFRKRTPAKSGAKGRRKAVKGAPADRRGRDVSNESTQRAAGA